MHGISTLLSSDSVWCYSIVVDIVTNLGTSYIYVRVRFVYKGSMRNFHLLSLPMCDAHTLHYMFAAVRNALRVIAGDLWDHKLLAVTTDVAADMTIIERGMVTLLQDAFPTLFSECGVGHLDFTVPDFIPHDLYIVFYNTLTSFVSYLRRQQLLC